MSKHFSLKPAGLLLLALGLALLAGCTREDPVALAREFSAKGEHDAALVHLRAAVQSDPQSAELRVMLADAQERKFDLAGAQENLEKALQSDADEKLANTLVPRIALLMLDRNELDELARRFHDTKLSDPAADSNLRGLVALAYLGLKRHDSGRTQVTLAQQPAASVSLAKAQMLVIERKPREALELLDLDGANKAAPWYVLRGGKRIAIEAGETAKALAYMQRAVEAVPWHAGINGEYGEALVTAGRFDDAKKVFEGLRKSHPGTFWTHYLGAMLMHREKRFEEAHALALRTLRVAPQHLPTLLLAASSEVNKGDLLVAERRLQAILNKHAESVPAWLLYAQVQGRLGRPQEQARAVKRGLELAPGEPQLLSLQADLQLAAGQFKPALLTLQALLARRPQDPDSMLKLAEAKFRSGDKAGASELVDKAGAAAGKDVAAATRAVSVALQLGNVTQADRLARELVARLPDEPMAPLSVAAVQSAQNNVAGARTTTLQVLDKHPTHEGALQALVSMSRTSEQQQELRQRYQAALEAGSKSAQTYLDYAALLRANPGDRRNTPLAVLEKGVQTLPTAVVLREALVSQLQREGEAEKATSVAQAGASMANAPVAAVALLAGTYERTGKVQQATELLRKLVTENPQRADWRLRLAQLDAGAGREAEAVTQLRTLVAERPFDVAASIQLAQMQVGKDVEGALSVARKLGEQPGLKGAGHLLAGDVMAVAGRTEEALAEFDRAAKEGRGTIALVRVVQLLERTGRGDAAERELQTALRKHPDDVELVSHAVRRATAKGDKARALELLSALAARAPANPYVLNDLAWAQIDAGRAEALGNAKRAASLLPDNPIVLHTLGLALAKAGKADEAVAALRVAANLAPQAEVPKLHLAQQLVATGDKVGAANALRGIGGESLSAADKASLGKLKAELGLS